MTLGEAWAHFQLHELRDPDVGRSPSTIACYEAYFKCPIIPQWGDVLLDDMKAVAVEKWLSSLDLAPGSKAKIRNHLSALFNHAIRHELYTRENPIRTVRQGATRQRDPDVLTIDELQKIVQNIDAPAVWVMVLTAAASALRRSELRGLKWADLDFDKLWFHLRRGSFAKTKQT
jgi:integrase